MKVTLISDVTPFWCLMDDEVGELLCHLSGDAPGPVELNWDELTISQKNHVRTGVLFSIISCDEPIPPSHPDKPLPKPIENKPVYGLEERLEEEAAMRKELVAILKGGVKQVRAHAADFEDTKKVSMLLDLERRGKNRKGLVTALVEKLKEMKLEEDRKLTESVMAHPALRRGMYTGVDILVEDSELALFSTE